MASGSRCDKRVVGYIARVLGVVGEPEKFRKSRAWSALASGTDPRRLRAVVAIDAMAGHRSECFGAKRFALRLELDPRHSELG